MTRRLAGVVAATLLVTTVATACGIDLAGTGSPSADAGAATDAQPSNDGASAELDGATESGDGCITDACPGRRCMAGACAFHPSCRALHAAAPSVPTGAYPMESVNGARYDAHCDMSTDSGGWTLVARSVQQRSSTSFGWLRDTGDLADDGNVYSLDASRVGLVFDALLIGTYGTGKAWSLTYKMLPPAEFPAAWRTTYTDPCAASVIAGGACAATPYMLEHLGRTDLSDHFFIRDNVSGDGYGLYPNGFRLSTDNCEASGTMSGNQGMIFGR